MLLSIDDGRTDGHPTVTLTLLRILLAKFHYTDTDTGTDTDFFAAKLRWVRAGPFGSVSVSV